MPRTVCVSAPSSELRKPIVLVVVQQRQIVGVVLSTNSRVIGLKTQCCVMFICTKFCVSMFEMS